MGKSYEDVRDEMTVKQFNAFQMKVWAALGGRETGEEGMKQLMSGEAQLVLKDGWQHLLDACYQHHVSVHITAENFPRVDDGTMGTVEERCLGYNVASIDKAREELKKLGYKPVGMRRAMKYIATHLNNQLDHTIVVTGAECSDDEGYGCVPCFGKGCDLTATCPTENDKHRRLYLWWEKSVFYADYHFLVTRK